MTVCTPQFGDLPQDAQALLTRTFDLDFSMSDFKAPRWFSAWARDEDGGIAGIFAIEFKYWFDGYVTVLVLDQRCMTKRTLRAIFTAAFTQARRLTAEVEPHNRRALKQVQRLGFQYTGYRRLGIEGSRDVMVFDMLKNECRYLPSYVPPAFPALNVANRHLMNAVVDSDSGLSARVGADRENISLGELGVGSVLPSPRSPFNQVLTPGLPSNMDRTDAAGDAAGVRRVELSSGYAPREDADDAMNFAVSPAVPHLRVAPRINGKRPEKAVVASVLERSGKRGLGRHRPSNEGV